MTYVILFNDHSENKEIIYNENNIIDLIPDFKRAFHELLNLCDFGNKIFVHQCISIHKTQKNDQLYIYITCHDKDFNKIEHIIELYGSNSKELQYIWDKLPICFGHYKKHRSIQIQKLYQLNKLFH
jgi:hypothetical protein